MHQSQFQPSAEYPDDIKSHTQTARLAFVKLNAASERPHHIYADFHQLISEWNTDNSDAVQHSNQNI